MEGFCSISRSFWDQYWFGHRETSHVSFYFDTIKNLLNFWMYFVCRYRLNRLNQWNALQWLAAVPESLVWPTPGCSADAFQSAVGTGVHLSRALFKGCKYCQPTRVRRWNVETDSTSIDVLTNQSFFRSSSRFHNKHIAQNLISNVFKIWGRLLWDFQNLSKVTQRPVCIIAKLSLQHPLAE